jgi:hypothetical protein
LINDLAGHRFISVASLSQVVVETRGDTPETAH